MFSRTDVRQARLYRHLVLGVDRWIRFREAHDHTLEVSAEWCFRETGLSNFETPGWRATGKLPRSRLHGSVRDNFDFEDCRPLLAGDEKAVMLRVVSNPV
jgi:hypothetical protein